MPKFRVLKANALTFARNVGDEVEIATPAEYQKHLDEEQSLLWSPSKKELSKSQLPKRLLRNQPKRRDRTWNRKVESPD